MAKETRDNPRSVVRRTLRVAARAPIEIRKAALLLSDRAASARGEPDTTRPSYPTRPMAVKLTSMYMTVGIPSARIIARGIIFLGFFTSSLISVILANPEYAKNA